MIWSVELVTNARLELVYLGTFIRRFNVSLKLTVSFLIDFWYDCMNDAKEHVHKWGNNMT